MADKVRLSPFVLGVTETVVMFPEYEETYILVAREKDVIARELRRI